MLRIAAIALLLTTSGNVADGRTSHDNQSDDSGQCSVPAYASAGRKPIKVFKAPRRSADSLGYLPVSKDEDGKRKGAYVTIVSMQQGWALIADAASWDNSEQGPNGWVEARHLRLALQTSLGFASPNPDSTIVVATDWLMPNQILKLEDCDGEWVKARVLTKGQGRSGWFRGACANQETTCDGVVGDPVSFRDDPSSGAGQ